MKQSNSFDFASDQVSMGMELRYGLSERGIAVVGHRHRRRRRQSVRQLGSRWVVDGAVK